MLVHKIEFAATQKRWLAHCSGDGKTWCVSATDRSRLRRELRCKGVSVERLDELCAEADARKAARSELK